MGLLLSYPYAAQSHASAGAGWMGERTQNSLSEFKTANK